MESIAGLLIEGKYQLSLLKWLARKSYVKNYKVQSRTCAGGPQGWDFPKKMSHFFARFVVPNPRWGGGRRPPNFPLHLWTNEEVTFKKEPFWIFEDCIWWTFTKSQQQSSQFTEGKVKQNIFDIPVSCLPYCYCFFKKKTYPQLHGRMGGGESQRGFCGTPWA